ncbi:DNA protecting protein DprA [Rhizobium rhizosphaerae]|uniref:DNA protecting protein DprA n=1 Tax=Xaviernesmea rhizosphaerae TaxID=1672749 RepID=A0ABX3PBZ7_9HYPH|nr:DNA-processing protein DprA [Xaviernesmea rhizosphaerae]OQP85551.1 DNA protecting protein DprA [Xaviernesmea rhizosphaerae]
MDDAREGTGIVLTERQRLAWLRLIRSDNVGPATFRDLINHFGSAERALEALPELSRRGGAKRPIRVASREEAERELERAHQIGARFVGVGEPDYPPALRQIDGAPPLLCVKGHAPTGITPALGVVGARNASVSGAKFAAFLAREAGKAGYSVISGLARGIDAAAHRATLDFGTIAVLAGGLDRPYPPENLPLLSEIVEGRGLAISEMPLGWEPRARDFPRRNRLIAGVALGLLVVEAAARSGSLISARYAGDFGRLVFAVPGSPLDPRSEGTNRLIKEGAILITGPADILEALAPLGRMARTVPPKADEPERPESPDMPTPDNHARAAILDALSPTPVEIDDLLRYTGLPAQTVYLILLELDLAGRLHRHAGGRVSLALGD